MRQKTIIVALSVALIAVLAVIAWSIPQLATPLSYRGDQSLIDRTFALRAKENKGRLPSATPIVMRPRRDQVCVELRTVERNGAGSFLACYNIAGEVIQEWQHSAG